ncbi:MAG: hypothetical protein M3094_09860 [Actinomycetia bacterium]|nr:hypothetical protein [Actinomycetes bacterium]
MIVASTFVADCTRAGLTILWIVAAIVMWRAQFVSPRMNGLRILAVVTVTLHAIFGLWFNAAVNLNWSQVAWHNEIARFLNALTASIFIVWGLLSIEHVKEDERHGMDHQS